jgi:hypothetical protein
VRLNRTITRALAACILLLAAIAAPLLIRWCWGAFATARDSTSPSPAASGPGTSSEPPLFADVTETSGVRFTYRNGEEADHLAILESLGGGIGVLDYDGDGLLDLFFPGGGYFEGQQIRGHAPKLYRNLGGFTFQDVTAHVGLERLPFYTHGVAVADYDRDGWPDLAVTGWGRLALFHNESDGKGGRRFVEVGARAGFVEHLWSTSAAWGDLDGDGWPDLYVCQYGDWSFAKNHPTDCYYKGTLRDVCPPARFKPLPHKVYRNNHDGTFSDMSVALGLRTDGKGLGVVIVDVNGDGRPDVFVANDTDENFLYVNSSRPAAFRLDEKALRAGVARDDRGTPNGSMGVDAADYNRTGRASLWCTHYENELHALYHNDCRGNDEFFTFNTQRAGIGAIGQNWVGWGTGFADFEQRGWEDLVIANGHAIRYPVGPAGRQQLPVLLHNDRGHFTAMSPRGGGYFRAPHNARGLVLADLDNDGKMDLVISHLNEPATLLRNVAATAGRHWLGITLAGKANRNLAGACVTVEIGGARLTRFVKGGGSYLCSGDSRLLFGLGEAATVERVEVRWPWGETQTWPGPTVDQYWRLCEGMGQPSGEPVR